MFVPSKYLVTVSVTSAVTGEVIPVVQHVSECGICAAMLLSELGELAEALAGSGHIPGVCVTGSIVSEWAEPEG